MSFIRAIGVYQYSLDEESDMPQKKQSHPPSTSGILGHNPFKKFETDMLPYMNRLQQNNYQKLDGEHYYTYLNQTNQLIVIKSRSEIDSELGELFYLMKNIEQIINHQQRVGYTLENVADNPMQFSGRYIGLDKTKAELAELKEIMRQNIERVLARGEAIESLQEKTIKLEAQSESFANASNRLKWRMRCSC